MDGVLQQQLKLRTGESDGIMAALKIHNTALSVGLRPADEIAARWTFPSLVPDPLLPDRYGGGVKILLGVFVVAREQRLYRIVEYLVEVKFVCDLEALGNPTGHGMVLQDAYGVGDILPESGILS